MSALRGSGARASAARGARPRPLGPGGLGDPRSEEERANALPVRVARPARHAAEQEMAISPACVCIILPCLRPIC